MRDNVQKGRGERSDRRRRPARRQAVAGVYRRRGFAVYHIDDAFGVA